MTDDVKRMAARLRNYDNFKKQFFEVYAHEAADALDAQAARIAVLEAALRAIDDETNHYSMTPTYSEGVLRKTLLRTRNHARAALASGATPPDDVD